SAWAEVVFLQKGIKSVENSNAVMDALRINPKRSLEELEDDWTTSMELAEALQKDHQIPFRVGHSFASSIVTYARANDLKPKDFPYAKAVELYSDAITKYKLPDTILPIGEPDFRKLLSPEFMVKSRVGIGGPQPAEVQRMLTESQGKLSQDKSWMESTRKKLTDADEKLDQAFNQLLTSTTPQDPQPNPDKDAEALKQLGAEPKSE